MVLEESLAQYGALGLWTVFNIGLIMYLIKRNDSSDEKNRETINNNTAALAEIKEVLRSCPYKKS